MNNVYDRIVLSHETAKIIVNDLKSNKTTSQKKAFIRECLKTSLEVNRSTTNHTLA